MIISGGSRSNWRFFAKHLTNATDNDRVKLVEIRGLAADSVLEGFRQMDAIASGTRCKNFFYHADLNPREDEQLTPEQWERATDLAENNLGLTGQPRMILEHEKNGRTHRHLVWLRIDVDSMTAISDSLTYRKHEKAAREIEAELDLSPVDSVLVKDRETPRPERRPKNWETFRGNKTGVDPEQVKEEVTALWQQCDTGQTFQAALEQQGYILCKGDRRDFCIVDPAGREHSLARRISGAKASDIRVRLADIERDTLPTIAEAKERNMAAGKPDTPAHQRLRRVEMDRAMEHYLRDWENPDAEEAEKAARRAEKASQRRERKMRLLYHEQQIARGASMASRDAFLAATLGPAGSNTTAEARDRAAHIAEIEKAMQPYMRAAKEGQKMHPAPGFFSRASEFMRRTAHEYGEMAKNSLDAARSTWTKYAESHAKQKDREEPDHGR